MTEKYQNASPSLIQHIQNLDAASGIFFFIGILLCKSQYFFPTIIGQCINATGLGCYFIGYILWLIECFIDPKKTQDQENWYSRMSVGQQFTIASFMGLAATALGIASMIMPILLLPTCWLFTTSNMIWCFGEYQKTQIVLNNNDSTYDKLKQQSYFHYVIVITLLSLINAIITTIALFYLPFLPFALMIGPYLGGVGLKAYIDINCFSSSKKKLIPLVQNKQDSSEASLAVLQKSPEQLRSPTLSSINSETPLPSPPNTPTTCLKCDTPVTFENSSSPFNRS